MVISCFTSIIINRNPSGWIESEHEHVYVFVCGLAIVIDDAVFAFVSALGKLLGRFCLSKQ